MQRLASTVGLGAWLGYSAGQAALLGIHALGFDANNLVQAVSGSDSALPPLAIGADEAALGAGLLGAVALALGTAVARLHGPSLPIRSNGERLAGAALCALAAMLGSAALAGSELVAVIGGGAGFTLALAATFGALLFDHMMEQEATDDGDEAFRAALAAVRSAPQSEPLERRQERVSEEEMER